MGTKLATSGRPRLVFAKIGFVGRVGRALHAGSEWKRRHAPPRQGIDCVTRRGERVSVLAVAERPKYVASRPARGQRWKLRRVEFQPCLVAGTNHAELIVVGLEQARDIAVASELARHPGQGGRVYVVVVVAQGQLAVGRNLTGVAAVPKNGPSDWQLGYPQL